jgi:hypothetical protein
MAITYHAGRRIQGLSTDEASTSVLSASDYTSSNFTTVGSTVAITSNSVVFSSTPTNADNGQYVQIDSLAETDTWSLNFKLNFSVHNTFDNYCLALTNTSGAIYTSNLLGLQTQGGGYQRFNFPTRISGSNSAAVSATNTALVNTDYWCTLSSDGTTATFKAWTNSGRTGTAHVTLTRPVSGLGTMNYIQHRTYASGDSSVWTGTVSEITATTKPTLTVTGVKPTNVQVGSRYEETDTRKMYHYNAPSSQDFASVLSTYAPQFFLKLDEGTGTALTNSGSTSGYTASITVDSSNPVWDAGVDGANKALKFTGGLSSSYIGHTNLPTESTGDNFTMGLTFKVPTNFTGGDANHHHLWKWNNNGLGFWQMNMTNDGYIGSAYFNGGWQHLVGTTDSSDNAWHTFFVTCTSGSSLIGYLDGVQEFSGTANRSGYAGNDVDWIGHNGGNGTISYDNVFFKNSVLTASEISSLHDLLVPATGNAWTEEGT